jgi:hypothetical protein
LKKKHLQSLPTKKWTIAPKPNIDNPFHWHPKNKRKPSHPESSPSTPCLKLGLSLTNRLQLIVVEARIGCREDTSKFQFSKYQHFENTAKGKETLKYFFYFGLQNLCEISVSTPNDYFYACWLGHCRRNSLRTQLKQTGNHNFSEIAV